MKLILFLLFASLSANAFNVDPIYNGTTWVVLVAGSNGWYNYRHQADIYHAYQVVRNHGIPEKNIIVFHYDDLAHNSQNPTPGQVINKPGGTDVYHGVAKDFVGADVTPKNFLGVLRGDQELAQKGKKVLQSGPNDHVFVYFADHGSTDLIAFPSEYLYGEDLNKALQYMYDNHKYSKLVFYLEACESGSMFNKLLPKNINIFATTASNPTESSYACYYDSKRQTYLGDVYSVKWIENSDRRSYGNETLSEQFTIVKKETNTSHVQEYGDLSIGNLPLTQFQGSKNSFHQLIGGDEVTPAVFTTVDSGDVPIHVLKNRIQATTDPEDKKLLTTQLQQLIDGREFLNNHFTQYLNSIQHLIGKQIDVMVNKKQELSNRQCYRKLVDAFHQNCLNLNKNPFVLRKLHILVNVCEEVSRGADVDIKVKDAFDHLLTYCHNNLQTGYPQPIE